MQEQYRHYSGEKKPLTNKCKHPSEESLLYFTAPVSWHPVGTQFTYLTNKKHETAGEILCQLVLEFGFRTQFCIFVTRHTGRKGVLTLTFIARGKNKNAT
jgi:hypothetical protein